MTGCIKCGGKYCYEKGSRLGCTCNELDERVEELEFELHSSDMCNASLAEEVSNLRKVCVILTRYLRATIPYELATVFEQEIRSIE